jgi:hypothetical protein
MSQLKFVQLKLFQKGLCRTIFCLVSNEIVTGQFCNCFFRVVALFLLKPNKDGLITKLMLLFLVFSIKKNNKKENLPKDEFSSIYLQILEFS